MITALRSRLRAGDHYNALLDLPGLSFSCFVTILPDAHVSITALDINQDTPVESLHTYLLGVVKYVWHFMHSSWSTAQCNLFATRLQAAASGGLDIPPIRAGYIVQYRNGLIGKHFRILQQLSVFQLDSELCPPTVVDLWRATGELGAHLWIGEIDDMEKYLVSFFFASHISKLTPI